MMVRLEIGVKPNSLASCSKAGHQSEIKKQPQGAVDSIQRYGGHPIADSIEYCFNIRMDAGFCHLTKDLQTLVRQFQAGPLEPVFQTTHSFLQLFRASFHDITFQLRCYSFLGMCHKLGHLSSWSFRSDAHFVDMHKEIGPFPPIPISQCPFGNIDERHRFMGIIVQSFTFPSFSECNFHPSDCSSIALS